MSTRMDDEARKRLVDGVTVGIQQIHNSTVEIILGPDGYKSHKDFYLAQVFANVVGLTDDVGKASELTLALSDTTSLVDALKILKEKLG